MSSQGRIIGKSLDGTIQAVDEQGMTRLSLGGFPHHLNMRDAVFKVHIGYPCKIMLCIEPLKIFLRADSNRTPGPTFLYDIESGA